MAFGFVSDAVGSAAGFGGGKLGEAWKGYSGKNTKTTTEPVYNSTRPDEERALGLDARGQQDQFGGLLQAQMAGRGPSLAQTQLAQSRDDMIRSQLAMAASGRGANVALANRTAAQGGARIGMQAARDSSMIRAQEQLAAQQQYAALLQAKRQQDLMARQLSTQEQLGQLQASTAYEKGLMDVGEGEATRRQKAYGGVMTAIGGLISAMSAKTDAQPIGVLSPGMAKTDVMPIGFDPFAAQGPRPEAARSSMIAERPVDYNGVGYARQDLAALSGQSGIYQPQPQTPTSDLANQFALDRQMMAPHDPYNAPNSPYVSNASKPAKESGGLSAMFSGLGTVSDPRLKEGSVPVGQSLGRVAAEVQPYSFRYKPFAAAEMGVGTEPRVGAMADGGPGSLEQNPIYRPAVRVGPDGLKRVDAGQATMANIAVTSDLAREQEDLKARFAELEGLLAKEKAKNSAAGAVQAHQRARGVFGSVVSGSEYDQIGSTNRDYDATPRMRKSVERAVSRGADPNVDPGNVDRFGDPNFSARYAAPSTRQGYTQDSELADESMFLPRVDYDKPTRVSPEDYRTDQMTLREKNLNSAAARTGGAKTRDDRVLGLRALADAMTPEMRRSVITPKALEQEAKRRGIKVKPGEARDALRDEMSL